MLESGFIRIYRSMLKWEWYDDTNTKAVFLHLILTANWEPKKWRGITIERGQRVYSSQKLAAELHMSRQAVRTAIKHLISTGEITNHPTPEYSIITVKNYDLYQQPTNDLTNEQPTANQRLTNEQPQLKKDKESNKDKNDKEDKRTTISYSEIQNLYSTICKSYPKCTKLSESRKQTIHARFASGYKLEDFKRLFEMAESSPFLKGKNNRNWQANFDWLIKDANMAKVLDGNYRDKGDDYNAGRTTNGKGNNEPHTRERQEESRPKYGHIV